MTWVCNMHRGFTLIELLIVITLMSTVLALVAPIGVDYVTKARGHTEFLKLQSTMTRLKQQAFLNASPIELNFADNQLTITRLVSWDERSSQVIDFEFLSIAEPVVITINTSGLATQNSVNMTLRNQRKALVLNEQFNAALN